MRKFQPKSSYIKPKKVDINTKYRMLNRNLSQESINFALDASRLYTTGWYNSFEGIKTTSHAYRIDWKWWGRNTRDRQDHGYVIGYMLMVAE